jgi:hypothetical protein
MTNIFLAAAAALVPAVVTVQNALIPKLRQQSISSGLTGPYHALLDASFAALSVALALAFAHGTVAQRVLAYAAGALLVATGVTGTWTDKIKDGEKLHTIFTALTFGAALMLQAVSNQSAPMWTITGAGIAAAAVTHYLVPVASVTEKIGVLGLCAWLIGWAL